MVSPTGITAEQILEIPLAGPEEQAGRQPPIEFSIVSEIQRQYYEGEISVEQYQTMLNEIQEKYTLTPEDIRIMVDWGKDLYWQQRGRMNRSGYTQPEPMPTQQPTSIRSGGYTPTRVY